MVPLCHAWGKMSWTLEWKRPSGQLFKITGQACNAFCLHHEPCAWSTAHYGELVTTKKKSPFLRERSLPPLVQNNLVQPWTSTWPSIQLTISHLMSKYLPQFYHHICICVSKTILSLQFFQIRHLLFYLTTQTTPHPIHVIFPNLKITYLVNLFLNVISSIILLHSFSRVSIYSYKTHSIHDHLLQFKDNFVRLKLKRKWQFF